MLVTDEKKHGRATSSEETTKRRALAPTCARGRTRGNAKDGNTCDRAQGPGNAGVWSLGAQETKNKKIKGYKKNAPATKAHLQLRHSCDHDSLLVLRGRRHLQIEVCNIMYTPSLQLGFSKMSKKRKVDAMEVSNVDVNHLFLQAAV